MINGRSYGRSAKNGKLLQDFTDSMVYRENSRCSSYFIGSGSCDPDSKSHWPMIFY